MTARAAAMEAFPIIVLLPDLYKCPLSLLDARRNEQNVNDGDRPAAPRRLHPDDDYFFFFSSPIMLRSRGQPGLHRIAAAQRSL